MNPSLKRRKAEQKKNQGVVLLVSQLPKVSSGFLKTTQIYQMAKSKVEEALVIYFS